jgi:hypothetical protein
MDSGGTYRCKNKVTKASRAVTPFCSLLVEPPLAGRAGIVTDAFCFFFLPSSWLRK